MTASKQAKAKKLPDPEQRKLAARLIPKYLRKHGQTSIDRIRLYLANHGVEDHNIGQVQLWLTAAHVIERRGEDLLLHQPDNLD